MDKTKILIVDDRKNVRQSVSFLLEYDGFQIIEASSGEEAIRTIQNDSEILIVFLDIQMDGISGIETLRQIKEIDTGIEVCMLSADDTESNIKQAFCLGACGFLIKPCDINEIIRNARQMEAKIKKAKLLSDRDKFLRLIRRIIKFIHKKRNLLQ